MLNPMNQCFRLLIGVGTDEAFIYYTVSPESDSLITFHKMGVTTGFAEEGYIQVMPEDTIPKEARIVITGSYFVKSEALKQGE